MTEYALVIAQQSAQLYKLNRGVAEHVATALAHDDPADWVLLHMPAQARCSLVSDIMDESYSRSELPPIWLKSTRQLLLQKRLTQQLREMPYRAAVLLPSGSWRPPVRASLIGMGQGERIEKWLAALAARQTRVKGLWPLSALIGLGIDAKAPRRAKTRTQPSVAEPAALKATLALVATPAGLRQVLVRGKTPLFSRLALNADEGSLSAVYVLTEARRTVQYLISQGWLSAEDQPVATQVWLPVSDDQALTEVDGDLALDVQLIEQVTDAYARVLPYLKTVSAQLQFLPEASRTAWRAAQMATAAKFVGIGALALSGLWSADLLWQSWKKRDLTQEQVVRAQAINAQARQEVLRAKGDLSEAGLAVATVQVWQASVAAQPDQVTAMQHVAAALAAAPGLTVEKIRWDLPVAQIEAAGATPVAAEAFGCPKPSSAGLVAAVGATPVAQPDQPEKPIAAMMNLTASVVEGITQRQALQVQENLLAQLNKNSWTASMVKSTVNLDASQSQTGTVGTPGARTIEICLQKASK